MKKLILMALLACVITQISNAQFRSVLAQPDSLPRFEFRFLRASFENAEKQGLLSGIYDLAFSYPFNKNWGIEVSMPVAFMKEEVPGYPYNPYSYGGGSYGGWYIPYYTNFEEDNGSKDGIGNLMLGARFQKWFSTTKCLQWRGQLYLPTSSKTNYKLEDFMAYTDVVDFPKYARQVTTASLLFGYYNNPQKGGFYYVDAGPQFMFSHNSEVDSKIYMRYAVGGGYNCGSGAISGEYIGQALVTEELDNFTDRFISTLNFGLHYTKGHINPSVFYSVYLSDELKDLVNGVLGVKVAVKLKS